ncbi:FliO/MopB family protein [Cryobacterium tepidiphilum]|uniref:Flagellar biosynthetic protein FliO n=1 Tax=Cryobacterium tepidiphilum TaxID=2486026 RepID=A0A3M8LPD0_9MICO|nr:flagellar biosynthetic protein FliO [Cryobacterium tepidiphilum]RNE66669.1 flagellar biosynthetic protein FliO [Cryobacterium tepidiphilum]
MDTVLVALRVVLSLAVVLGLLWYVQRRVTGRAGAKRSAGIVTVVGRHAIGQKASVVVVDVEATRFVLGVTEQNVTVIHTEARGAIARARHTAPMLEAVPTTAQRDDEFARLLADAAADQEEKPLEPPLVFRPRRELHHPERAGKLGGSILSPATWQQTAAALRQGR